MWTLCFFLFGASFTNTEWSHLGQVKTKSNRTTIPWRWEWMRWWNTGWVPVFHHLTQRCVRVFVENVDGFYDKSDKCFKGMLGFSLLVFSICIGHSAVLSVCLIASSSSAQHFFSRRGEQHRSGLPAFPRRSQQGSRCEFAEEDRQWRRLFRW